MRHGFDARSPSWQRALPAIGTRLIAVLFLSLAIGTPENTRAAAEPNGTVVMRVRTRAAPVTSAEVSAEAGPGVLTNERGEARLSLPAGPHDIAVSRAGFSSVTLQVYVRAGAEIPVTVQLQEQRVESEVVQVFATRSGRIVQDQPLRVEVVPEEEIEENLTIAPGNLTTLLNELGGLRVQATNAALGGASLRLQGLAGRYTQILLDELPLYGERPDDFSLLQTPPLDLAQVEIIKGTSSALYGGSALGGLINLVSRRPGTEPEVLLNQTSHRGSDAVGFATGKLGGGWGMTLLGGAHRQSREDIDGDGWADLPGYWRGELRPRMFWNNDTGSSLFATFGTTVEDREGGTLGGATTPDGIRFRERLQTRRTDGGLVGRFLVSGDRLVTVRTAVTGSRQDHRFGEDRERDFHGFALAEATLTGTDGGHTWVAGAAIQRDWFRSNDLPIFDYAHLVPAVFVQDEYAVSDHVVLAASGRVDFDHENGTVFNPLVSALVRPGAGWNVRVSAGTGYAAPVPSTEETEVVGLSRVLPLQDVDPERAKSASLDIGWSRTGFEVNGTLFASEVNDPLVLRESSARPGRFEITNAPGPTRTYGTEFLARFATGGFQMIAMHTYTHSTESDPSSAVRREVPLTPRHVGELAWIYEKESLGRVGIELGYTGRQRLEHDPYRQTSRPYVEVNALAELRLGEMSIFANGINLTGVRQTRYDPLLLPARAPDGRWTTDVWAPLEGRVFNAGVRFDF